MAVRLPKKQKPVKVRRDLTQKAYTQVGYIDVKSKTAKGKISVIVDGKKQTVLAKDVYLLKNPKTYKSTKGEVVPTHRVWGQARSDPEWRRIKGDFQRLTPQKYINRTHFHRLTNTNTFVTSAKGSVVEYRGSKLEDAAGVNAANEELQGGGGVDGAITMRGGDEMRAERKALPRCIVNSNIRCKTGDAVITCSGNFKFQKVGAIIHAVGPNFYCVEEQVGKVLLLKTIKATLNLAKRHGIKEIAFPLISGGIFRAHVPLKTIVQIIVAGVFASTYIGLKEVMITGFNDEEEQYIKEVLQEFSTADGMKNFLENMDHNFVTALANKDNHDPIGHSIAWSAASAQ